MKHFLAIVTSLLLSCAVCFANETAQTPSQPVLTVEVTNRTENGSTVAEDEVIVQIYKDGQLLDTLEGKAAAEGMAVFENVPTGPHVVALPRAKHQDMMFSGPAVALRPGEDRIAANVPVFDVSFDKSKLSIQTHHIMIKTLPTALEFTEFMQLTNSSDMAVSSDQEDDQGKPIVLKIMLPDGFKNLKFTSYFQENALVVTEKGFYDTMAVPPGQFSLNFSYTLDIASETLDIVKRFSLPTSSLILFAELGQAKLQGLGELYNSATGPNGAAIEYYKRSDLAPEEKIAFQITGFNVSTSGPAMWVILAVVFGAILVLVVLRMRPTKI